MWITALVLFIFPLFLFFFRCRGNTVPRLFVTSFERSLIRVFAVRLKTLWILAKILIRLHRCAGWVFAVRQCSFVGNAVAELICIFEKPSLTKKKSDYKSINNEPAHDKTYNKTYPGSKDSDQPAPPRSLIRVFADRMCLLQSLGYPKTDKQEPLPYWVDVQDLSLCSLHRFYCRFCRALAQMHWITLS